MVDQEMEEKKLNEHVENFGRACKSFYARSFTGPSDETTGNTDEAPKVVLEALDFYLQHDPTDVEVAWKNNQQSLSADSIQHYAEDLKSCGFLDEVDGQTKFPIPIPPDVLLKYTQVKDQQRRSVHIDQMSLRMKHLDAILSSLPTKPNVMTNSEDGTSHPSVTRNSHIKHIRSITSQYMERYKSNIGCHSFIAGLRNVLEKQLSDETGNRVIQWTFQGSVLTECVIHGKVAEEEYLKDSLELLLSFMIRVPPPHDLEKGESAPSGTETEGDEVGNEYFLSFHIDPFISNARLGAIVDKIPSRNNLHLKATGKFDTVTNETIRKNASGKLDEAGFMSFMGNWSDSFCTVL